MMSAKSTPSTVTYPLPRVATATCMVAPLLLIVYGLLTNPSLHTAGVRREPPRPVRPLSEQVPGVRREPPRAVTAHSKGEPGVRREPPLPAAVHSNDGPGVRREPMPEPVQTAPGPGVRR